MKKKLLSRWDIPVYILIAAFYFWLAAQIPYTHDDWDWGLDIGLTQLFTANLNARYAGNFFEVVMTRSELLRILIMGSGFFLLPYLLSGIAYRQTKQTSPWARAFFFLAANVLILSMPRPMWQQVYGWTAGYANFGLSALFMVAAFGKLLEVFRDAKPRLTRSSASWFDLFALVLIGQLFIENISIYMVFACAFVLLVHLKKEKKLSVEYGLMTLAAVIGLVIVFSSDIYKELWDTGNAVSGYRKMFFNSTVGIGETIASCLAQAERIGYLVFEENLTLVLAVTAVLSLAALLKPGIHKAKRIVCVALNALFFLFFLLNRYQEFVTGYGWRSLISAFFFLAVTVEIFLLYKDKAQRNRLLFTWLSVVAVMAPLVATSEDGPRMYFTSNAFMTLFVLLVAGELLAAAPKKALVLSTVCCAIVLAVLLGSFGKVYYEIGVAKRERVDYIAQEVEAGSGVILIPRYPHTEYIWRPNPINDLRVHYFKEFYGIPQDVSLYF